MPKRKIILLGYMGSGKSTIAKLLAESLQLPSIDLDKEIEKTTGLPIPEIFEKHGEIYFRKVEHEVFADLLLRDSEFVLALGGGTPCYANNHLLLNGTNISFYLKASIDTLFGRLKIESNERPLITGKTDLEMREFIAKNLFDRSYYYHHATFTVTVDGKSTMQIASEIQTLLT